MLSAFTRAPVPADLLLLERVFADGLSRAQGCVLFESVADNGSDPGPDDRAAWTSKRAHGSPAGRSASGGRRALDRSPEALAGAYAENESGGDDCRDAPVHHLEGAVGGHFGGSTFGSGFTGIGGGRSAYRFSMIASALMSACAFHAQSWNGAMLTVRAW